MAPLLEAHILAQMNGMAFDANDPVYFWQTAAFAVDNCGMTFYSAETTGSALVLSRGVMEEIVSGLFESAANEDLPDIPDSLSGEISYDADSDTYARPISGGGFSVEEDATVQYASYGNGFVLWGIALSNPRGDTASFLLDDATGCVLALSYTFSDSFAFQIRQNDLWDYLLCVFENRVGATVAAALGVPYDEVQIPMPEAAKKMLGLRASGGNTVPLQLLNAGNEGSYNDGMDSSITDYLQFYDPDADTAFSLPAWRVENTLYFNAQ